MMTNGLIWVLAANLVIWTGLFLYLLRLERKLGASNGTAESNGDES
jgi:CcmD family protein